jgi:hypothetical protein
MEIFELHELCLRLPRYSESERTILRRNMIERVESGLPALENPILLLDDQIVDGRHRYEIWQELAEEEACGGYFSELEPPIEDAIENLQIYYDELDIELTDDELHNRVLLTLHSRNLCNRSLTAEQKAAQLLLDIDALPQLRDTIEKIEATNKALMKVGTKNPSGSTNQQLAQMVNVSESTMKNLKRIQKNNPEQLDQIRSGRISASDALRKKPKVVARPKTDARIGEHLYTIMPIDDGDITLQEVRINGHSDDDYIIQTGEYCPKNDAYDFFNAKLRRKEMLREGIEKMKTALSSKPKVINVPRHGLQSRLTVS